MNTTRWNVAVSTDVDRSLRIFLASQGKGKKGDLSKFIEEAVRTQILDLTVQRAKSATAHMSEAEVLALVDEAVDWARKKA